MDILLKNGHIIDPLSNTDRVGDVLILDGIIREIGPNISARKNTDERNLYGALVVPGFIDMHVHLREPGFEHKETIESGCMAAAKGGFTAVCCMPNTDPPIDDASLVMEIIAKGRRANGGIIDVYPIAAATKRREGKELSPMMELADAGAVAFTDDGAPIESSELMRLALEYAHMTGKPVIQHAEELTMTRGGVMNEGVVSTILGLPAMPPVAEEIVVARDLHLAKYLRTRYHVAHISTAGTVELVRQAKSQSLPVTCEVTPHHFSLTEEAVRTFDTNTKMNPPLRTQADVDAIKAGLKDGTIDVIATDHAPHSFDEKQVEFANAPFGIIGLETAVGLCFTHLVHPKVITLVQLIEKCSTNPRKILRLPEIGIAEGERANLSLIDADLEWTVDIQAFKSKSKNSPFNGARLTGKALGVINNNGAYFI